MLGEVTLDADGKQVPLPFEMTVPANLSGRLSAVIRVNNQPRWLLRDLPFADGTEPVDLGELILEPVTALLARKAGRPVQWLLTREEVFLTGRRYGGIVRMKTGFKRDGRLVAREVEVE